MYVKYKLQLHTLLWLGLFERHLVKSCILKCVCFVMWSRNFKFLVFWFWLLLLYHCGCFPQSDYFWEGESLELFTFNGWTHHKQTTIPVSHDHSHQAYIRPWSTERAASNWRHFTFQPAGCRRIRLVMIDVSRKLEFSNCGNMNPISMVTSSDQDLDSMAGHRGRQRSHSYYSQEDCKNYGVQTQTEETFLRPRSRYVFII